MKMADHDSTASSSDWKKLSMCWSPIGLFTSSSATFWQPLEQLFFVSSNFLHSEQFLVSTNSEMSE